MLRPGLPLEGWGGLGGGAAHAYGCGAEFDRFEGVFDLEEAAFGGEGARQGWSMVMTMMWVR
jgi:hypothetical protein